VESLQLDGPRQTVLNGKASHCTGTRPAVAIRRVVTHPLPHALSNTMQCNAVQCSTMPEQQQQRSVISSSALL
jgi:hypothetical protein